MYVDGGPDENHFVSLLDYMSNPCIKLKNYIILGDAKSLLEMIEESDASFKGI